MEYINELILFLKGNQFLSGGVVLGLFASVFYPLKNLPFIILNKIKYYFTYKIYMDQSDDVYDIFSQWFRENYPDKFKNIEVRFHKPDNGYADPTYRKRKWEIIKYQFSDSNFIWYKNRLLWITKERRELQQAKDFNTMNLNIYSIQGLFAKNAIDCILNELLKKKIELNGGNSINLYIPDYSSFRCSSIGILKNFNNIFFEGKDDYIADLDDFIKKGDFYKEKGINYKRSYLFHGCGGTGKSTLAQATAQYLNYDIYSMNLQGIQGDDKLILLAANIPPKSLILFEDIDCYFNDRDVKNDRINFSTVLNVFDGVYSPSDCIFIITTNKFDQLDEALIRKGRVDKILHIDYPRIKDIEDFMSNFYDSEVKLNIDNFNYPIAEVQEVCLSNSKEEAIKEIIKLSKSKKLVQKLVKSANV